MSRPTVLHGRSQSGQKIKSSCCAGAGGNVQRTSVLLYSRGKSLITGHETQWEENGKDDRIIMVFRKGETEPLGSTRNTSHGRDRCAISSSAGTSWPKLHHFLSGPTAARQSLVERVYEGDRPVPSNAALPLFWSDSGRKWLIRPLCSLLLVEASLPQLVRNTWKKLHSFLPGASLPPSRA